jgi:hypothetical protein
MAAFSGLPLEVVEEQYGQTEWFRRPTYEEYVERINAARGRGFALDLGDRRNGLNQVAVPIFSQSGSLALQNSYGFGSISRSDGPIRLLGARTHDPAGTDLLQKTILQSFHSHCSAEG